jgi:hypothetical protein
MPPFIWDRCFRMAFISLILAPQRSRAEVRASMSARVMPSTGRVIRAEPPPEMRQITRSPSAALAANSTISLAPVMPAASGIGCPASFTRTVLVSAR